MRLLPLLLVLLFCTCGRAQEFMPILQGSNFTGWHIQIKDQGVVSPEDQAIFSLRNGQLRVYPGIPDQTPQPYAALITDSVYQNFHLKLEYKWGQGKYPPRGDFVRDAGILFHVFDTTQFWASGLECQIQEGDTGDAWLIGARAQSSVQDVIRNYDPKGKIQERGGTYPRFSRFHRAYCWERTGWNSVEVIVKGAGAEFYVNGHLVNALQAAEYPGPGDEWLPLDKGRIILQAEGAQIHYRSVVLKRL
ncbi:DUF1080 domain-containing protein [Lewinella lacunae]|uniref:DUF1080 domain-containing protein n=2 Tax=Neolewinella lacunae TaxID=1517758 RepID=A0A923PMC1_9BACT|nr:DUF1080 domain-containing protein [Neolewinella lacunae]MBC6995075.1 DUF1080 domain-containing protein [Neolewinella lacunae]